ncbi:MAG: NADPH-dependent FMN reductase [Leptolyngbya sp. BL-A-14]
MNLLPTRSSGRTRTAITASMKHPSRPIQLLAISGSLRERSSNTALLQAAIALAPKHVEIRLYKGLGDLPHFNPDLEPYEPAAVTDLRQQLHICDGLIISSPEYAHSIPGVLKNALDWLVSGEEFVGKPVALLNASPRATYAQATLREVVTVMSGHLVAEASIDIPLLGRNLDAAGIVADPDFSTAINGAIVAFVAAIEKRVVEQSPSP